MSIRIHPAIHVVAIIVVVFLTLGIPYAGIALSAVLTIANWKTPPPWRITYIVLAIAMVLLYLAITPASVTAH